MKWVKKGLIFCTQGNYDWNKSHAQVPIAQIVDNKIRIFYSTRDINNKSVISYVDVDAENPSNVLFIYDKPILNLGSLGTFDDSGMMPTSIVEFESKIYLYYIGWNVRGTVPYHNSLGLAISEDHGRTFTRFSEGPIVERSYVEPFFTGTAYVIRDNNKWKMWYLSCIKWELVNNKQEPFYNIKYCESPNGIDWNRKGKVAIELKQNEGGIASASVINFNSKFLMWYSYRGFFKYRTDKENSYKIGFATSLDGIDWIRNDNEAGISLSEEGWDSEMLAYPNVIKYNNKFFMFYNGNGFGKTGFGYAVLEF